MYTFRGFLPDLEQLADKLPVGPTGPAVPPSSLLPSSGYFEDLLEDVAKDLPTRFPDRPAPTPAPAATPPAEEKKPFWPWIVGGVLVMGIGFYAVAKLSKQI